MLKFNLSATVSVCLPLAGNVFEGQKLTGSLFEMGFKISFLWKVFLYTGKCLPCIRISALLNIWLSRLRWQQNHLLLFALLVLVSVLHRVLSLHYLWHWCCDFTDSIHRRLRFAQGNLRVRRPGNGVILVGVMEGMMTVFIPLQSSDSQSSWSFILSFLEILCTQNLLSWVMFMSDPNDYEVQKENDWMTENEFINHNVFQCSLVSFSWSFDGGMKGALSKIANICWVSLSGVWRPKHVIHTIFIFSTYLFMFFFSFVTHLCFLEVTSRITKSVYGNTLQKVKANKVLKNCISAHTSKLENSIDVSGPYFQGSLQLLILTVEGKKMLDASSDSRSPGQLMSDTDCTWTPVEVFA